MADTPRPNPFDKYDTPSRPNPFDKYDAPSGSTYPSSNAPGIFESLGRGAVDGATFGFDDKLGFDKARREESRRVNPWAHFVGEVLGGAVPMTAAALIPTGGGQVAAGARGADLLRRGAGLVRSALVPGEIATATQGALQGAKLGLTTGALSGAGHADVKDDDSLIDALGKRAAGAGAGAMVGTALGAPLGAAGHGLYRAGQYVGGMRELAKGETAGMGQGALNTAVRKFEESRITPDEVIQLVRSQYPDTTIQAGGNRFYGSASNRRDVTDVHVDEIVRMVQAARSNGTEPSATRISDALKAANNGDGPGPDAVRTMIAEMDHRHLGPLNLVDYASMVRRGSGDPVQMSMRASAATPGEHVGIARENLLERQVGAQGRMGQLFDKIIGSGNYEAVAAKHAADLQQASTRAYGAAYASEKPFDLNPVFNKWQAKYQDKRGPIPDGIMSQLDAMRSTQPVLTQSGTLAKPNPGLVNKSPPMDLEGFILARQGLYDAIQTAKKDRPNLARNLNELYTELTEEVGKSNPKWLEANQIWRDGKVAEEALEAGTRMSTRLSANSRENLSHFTDAQKMAAKASDDLADARKALKTAAPGSSDEIAAKAAMDAAQARIDAAAANQELFKVGLVRSLNDMLANQAETHDVAKNILLPGAQKMLRQVLGKDADQFIRTVRAEQAMARTYKSQFGSQTQPLNEAIKEQTWAPRFEVSALNPLTWGNPILQLIQEHAARTVNAKRNIDLMDFYTMTDPVRQQEALRAMQTVHKARSNAGNTIGKPAVAVSAPIANAQVGSILGPQIETRPIKPYRQP